MLQSVLIVVVALADIKTKSDLFALLIERMKNLCKKSQFWIVSSNYAIICQ